MPRSHQIRTVVLGLLGGLALTVVPLTESAQASPSDTYERSVHVNTNHQRAQHHRKSLRGATCLDMFAERQARAMAKRGYIYHQKLDPILNRCKLRSVGENVASGFPDGRSAVSGWMKSHDHRVNMLDPDFRLIAVGAYRNSKGRWYVSQLFGRSL